LSEKCEITPFLERLGIVVLDPCKKPIIGFSHGENRELFERLKKEKSFDLLNDEVRKIRKIDLYMVSVSNFVIAYVDNDINTCGTWEEIGKANDQNKPVLVVCEQGKVHIPFWVWGMIPHEHIFGEWTDLIRYLHHVHSDENVDDMERWIFFDYSKLMPKVSIEGSEFVI